MDSEVRTYNVVISESKNSDGGITYRPTYYYRVNGKNYVYTLSYYTNVAVSKMEIRNIIYYDSSDPSNCVSEFETTINGVNIFIIFVTLIITAVGLNGIIGVRRKIKKAKLELL